MKFINYEIGFLIVNNFKKKKKIQKKREKERNIKRLPSLASYTWVEIARLKCIPIDNIEQSDITAFHHRY